MDKKLEEISFDEVKYFKIRASLSDQTCSVFYDDDKRKLINRVMKKGDKILARTLVNNAFTKIKHVQLRKYNKEKDESEKEKIPLNPLVIYHSAIKNLTPSLYLTKIKKSGTWYQIPVGIKPNEAKFRAIQWLLQATMEKSPVISFEKALADEILAAHEKRGKAFNKKLELLKMCEANRSIAHYKWT